MSLFKNKKPSSTTISILENRLEEAIKRNEHSFYYAIPKQDLNSAREYFFRKYNAIIEPSHKTDSIIVYKIYGYIFDNF